MKRDFLEGLKIEGLTKEVIDSIMTEHGKDLVELKKLDPAGLQAKFIELQTKYADDKKTWEKQLSDTKKSNGIKNALGDIVQDADLVMTLLDGEKIALGDKGQVIGLEDQLKDLKESKSFLFKEGDGILGTKLSCPLRRGDYYHVQSYCR